MRYAGLTPMGRFATRLATWAAPPHKASISLASLNPRGYIAPSAIIYHSDLCLGAHIMIGDRVIIYQNKQGGRIELGDRVCVLRDTAIETGFNGTLTIGNRTMIHPRCQVNAYLASIKIGTGVDIAPNCALYSYDHGMAPNQLVREQSLQTKGDIIIDDHVWLGVGAIVLSGVRIGSGAVIGAGSVVTKDIPDGAIAAGNPAVVLKMRSDALANDS
jgi:acetyltransferase-like isoleucine patch superfamily enzyme